MSNTHTRNTLYPQQREHVDAIKGILSRHSAALDSSETGTGKTLCAVTIAKEMGLHLFVICPKTVIPAWEKEMGEQDVKGVVTNYEKLKQGGRYGRWVNRQWKFDLPPNVLIVWDEVHKAKAPSSQNAKMLIASKPWPTLMLSATAAENPTEMRAIGYLLGLFNLPDYWRWCRENGCEEDPVFGGLKFLPSNKDVLTRLHAQIYPEHGHRMTKEELRDRFQENEIIDSPIDFEDGGEIARILAEMEAEIEVLKEARGGDSKRASELTVQLRARQEAELLKVPKIVEMVEDYVRNQNLSVAVFLNFSATIEAIRSRLRWPAGVIQGGQNAKSRQDFIEAFQKDDIFILLCNIAAGGVGVSLHDTNGNRPRVALISPTYNAKDLQQVFGRIHRAGGKTPCLQRVLVAGGTIEERVTAVAKRKTLHQELMNTGEPAI